MSSTLEPVETESSWSPRWPALAACGAVLVLYSCTLLLPRFRHDDYHFLIKSRTWEETCSNLWLPINEHAAPLCRLLTWLLIASVPPSWLPLGTALLGPLAVVLGMALLYLFVSRELGHPYYGLLAMILFGVTSTYHEAVTWYAAAFHIPALDTLLLALLAGQDWLQSRRLSSLALCAVISALAPGWFGGGILVGPWCGLYLALAPGRSAFLRMVGFLVPLLGSVAFLVVSMPRTADRIIYAEHFRMHGKTLFEAFNPTTGAVTTARTLVDNQIPGMIGIFGIVLPIPLVVVGLVLFMVIGAWWFYRGPSRQLMVLGLAIVVGFDLLVYSARAQWSYANQMHAWTRYHLFPHLGLVLFICGGLPSLAGRWFTLDLSGRLSDRQMLGLVSLIAVLTICHWPNVVVHHDYDPQQQAVLQRVERMDARCQAHGISAATAREALGFLKMPMCYEKENAWEFLHGSPTPRNLSVEEARRLLSEEE